MEIHALTDLLAVSCRGIISFLVTTGAMVLFLPLAKGRLIDSPNYRSTHTIGTPRGGGLPVFLGVSVAMLGTRLSWDAVALLGLTLGMAALGLSDDFKPLPVIPRFTTQVVAGIVFAVVISEMDGYSHVEYVAVVALCSVWIPTMINVFNFMDGINGISSITFVIAGLWYLTHGGEFGGAIENLVLACVGSVLAFLPWNFPHARSFLGDVGSYGLGAVIGGLVVLGALRGVGVLIMIAPLTLYLADGLSTVFGRVWRHEEWWVAHRLHVYQRTTDLTGRPLVVTGLVGILTAAMCGIVALPVEVELRLALMGALTIVYLSIPRAYESLLA